MVHDENNKKFPNAYKETKNIPQYVKTSVTEAFKIYSKEMEVKQDKYERIVKLSRDITISSKRAIFALHALMRSNNYEEDLSKVTDTLKIVENTLLKAITLEIMDEDPYQFSRAYTAGLQEYIEAVTFYHFITQGKLINLDEIKKKLTFKDITGKVEVSNENIGLLIPFFDYILGVQDLTGELMRHCISSFGVHNLEVGNSACNLVKYLYCGMLYLNGTCQTMQGRDFSKKLNVTLQSLKKMEIACYATHIRGSEALDFGFNPCEPSMEVEYL